MSSVRLGLVGALALGLLGSGSAATLAQGEVTAPFQTGIYAGTCVDLGVREVTAQVGLAERLVGQLGAISEVPVPGVLHHRESLRR